MFTQYWRRRALEQLSGFGFQVSDAKVPIDIPGLGDLIAAVEEVYRDEITAARELVHDNLITFDALGDLYDPGTPVQGVTALGGAPGVFLVAEYYSEERRSLLGLERSFHMSLEFVLTLGDHFTVARFTEVLSGWTGVRARPLTELTYVPVAADKMGPLLARGRQYVEVAARGPQFLAYDAHSFFLHPSGTSGHGGGGGGGNLSRGGGAQVPKPGRIMVDPARGALLGHHASQGMDEPTQAMMDVAARYRRWRNANTAGGATSTSGPEGLVLWTDVPNELMVFCWPAVVGFSFTAKVWGHVLVAGLKPIAFYERAFDQLVLPEERKRLIRALVRFGGDDATDDIVGGKRGGSVFLLHGPPGVGKTLTAEAIAEVLKRPLYSISMGELGLTPDDMEKRLSDVLELCAGWNALVLLDEADVFLEQRQTSDIVRNAMVCVMLRLLEYHPGILFLTTNRVRTFDPAFESRVTVALRYDHLSPAARAQVWRNLFQRVSVPVDADLAYDDLARHELNGRQIKNAVRLAVSLARESSCAVSNAILDTTLRVTQMGRADMRTDDSWKEPSAP